MVLGLQSASNFFTITKATFKQHPKKDTAMKYLLKPIVIGMFACTALVGCGETGDKALKAAAKAILEEENKTETTLPQAPAEVTPIANNQEAPSAQTLHDIKKSDDNGDESTNTSEDKSAKVAKEPDEDSGESEEVAVKPKQSTTKEKIVRYPASVLTQYGGNVIVRKEPNKNSPKKGLLYDQEEIWVVGITDKCETINKLEGCWVKVIDSVGLSGYSFDAYLQYWFAHIPQAQPKRANDGKVATLAYLMIS